VRLAGSARQLGEPVVRASGGASGGLGGAGAVYVRRPGTEGRGRPSGAASRGRSGGSW